MAADSPPASGWSGTAPTPPATPAIASWIPSASRLDNYDVTGRWRIRENMVALDTRGDYYDGTSITTPSELTRVILKRPVPLVRNFTAHLLAYAIGRRVEYFDQPAIRVIANDAEGRRIQDVLIHSGRRQERSVPNETNRGDRGCGSQPRGCNAMHFITGKHLSRRTFLRGMGTTVALPLLDSHGSCRQVVAGPCQRRLHAPGGHRRVDGVRGRQRLGETSNSCLRPRPSAGTSSSPRPASSSRWRPTASTSR